MNLEQAIKAIQNLPKRYEGDGNEYSNSPSCNLILNAPILEIMTTYGLSFEDATALQNIAKRIDSENYWKFRVAQDKYFKEQEKNKTEPTIFGSILYVISAIIFIICCFGGIAGFILGIMFVVFIGWYIEDNHSKKKYLSNIVSEKTSPLVQDGDLRKFYSNLYKSWNK